jgi:hypothetical protein
MSRQLILGGDGIGGKNHPWIDWVRGSVRF